MTKTSARVFCAMAAIVVVAVVIDTMFLKNHRILYTKNTIGDEHSEEVFFSNPDPISCTIFTASYGDKVLFGNNEDWINPNTYYWVIPSSDENYGVVYFGFDNFWPQGGINEKGLAFDVNALPRSPLNPHPERPKVRNPFYDFLKTCATVEEIIEKVKSYSWERSWKAQLHVADRTGNAVIISAGPNGEIAFTGKQKGDGYLVSTNFNRANPENGRYPCSRYNTTVAMLKKMQNEGTLTSDYFRSILDAVHVEGASVNTVYSNIFDLTNGIIYLYHWHHYDEVVELNVPKEVTRALSPTRIEDLFSQKTVDQASKEYRSYRKKITTWKTVIWIWIILATVSIIVLIGDLEYGLPTPWAVRLSWALVMVLFGPFGLIAYLYSYRQPLRSPELQAGLANWKHALGETVFDVTGYAIGIALAISTIYLILPFNESSLWSLVARFYGLPLIIGLFFFHAPVLVFVGKNQYWMVIRRRILTEIISLNFTLVGMLPVSCILMDLTEKHLGMMGPGSFFFWGVIALSACFGALTVYPFNTWLAHGGFYLRPGWLSAGGENTQETNAKASPSLHKAWGVLILSFAFLSGSIVLLFSYLL